MPDVKDNLIKAHGQTMLGSLENGMIFKDFERPLKDAYPLSPLPDPVLSLVSFLCDCSLIGKLWRSHNLFLLFHILLSDTLDSQVRKIIRKIPEWCGERRKQRGPASLLAQ